MCFVLVTIFYVSVLSHFFIDIFFLLLKYIRPLLYLKIRFSFDPTGFEMWNISVTTILPTFWHKSNRFPILRMTEQWHPRSDIYVRLRKADSSCYKLAFAVPRSDGRRWIRMHQSRALRKRYLWTICGNETVDFTRSFNVPYFFPGGRSDCLWSTDDGSRGGRVRLVQNGAGNLALVIRIFFFFLPSHHTAVLLKTLVCTNAIIGYRYIFVKEDE